MQGKKLLKEIQKDDFLRDYVIRSYDEIGKTKTILHPESSQYIEKFCVSTSISYLNTKRKRIKIETDQVINILRASNSHKIIITGVGGTGKTILMKFIHINCIKQLNLIPVFIELRNIRSSNNGIDIKSSIKCALTRYGAEVSDAILDSSLINGCYLFLFDGFDEVNTGISNSMSEAIIDFSRRYNKNYYIVSSRPSDKFINWSDFKEFRMNPLSKQQALELIDKIDYDDKKIISKNNWINYLEAVGDRGHLHTFQSHRLP